ncbi:helix-turn-helix domain-containing protein [Aquimarina sp. RZ0]|uniref:helix-turn-helix domain-containing protein n=1 Tax=Aquimarina sp. RZ0 TaxID=2607730 RepID=UPI0011F1FEA5|nr:helix-turn-helix domain-containing protein [Aquimarina sp. RZ0]KAA1243326.1 helix-turn-helix domain-containing protein [Aquimarina sp. RZ0]
MSNLSKPLFSLTIEEYKELQRELFNEQAERLAQNNTSTSIPKEDKDLIFLEEVCEITGYTKPTLYSKISRFEIPVLSRGKPLTFSKKEIIEWIHQGKPHTLEQEADAYIKRSIPK